MLRNNNLKKLHATKQSVKRPVYNKYFIKNKLSNIYATFY